MYEYLVRLEYHHLIFALRVITLILGLYVATITFRPAALVFKRAVSLLDWMVATLHLLTISVVMFQGISLARLVDPRNDPWTIVALSVTNMALLTAAIFGKRINQELQRYRRWVLFREQCDTVSEASIIDTEATDRTLIDMREHIAMRALGGRGGHA